jgi:hypothetical protein
MAPMNSRGHFSFRFGARSERVPRRVLDKPESSLDLVRHGLPRRMPVQDAARIANQERR